MENDNKHTQGGSLKGEKSIYMYVHCVSKNVPPLDCYNYDTRECILIFLAEMLPIKQAIKRRFTVCHLK